MCFWAVCRSISRVFASFRQWRIGRSFDRVSPSTSFVPPRFSSVRERGLDRFLSQSTWQLALIRRASSPIRCLVLRPFVHRCTWARFFGIDTNSGGKNSDIITAIPCAHEYARTCMYMCVCVYVRVRVRMYMRVSVCMRVSRWIFRTRATSTR